MSFVSGDIKHVTSGFLFMNHNGGTQSASANTPLVLQNDGVGSETITSSGPKVNGVLYESLWDTVNHMWDISIFPIGTNIVFCVDVSIDTELLTSADILIELFVTKRDSEGSSTGTFTLPENLPEVPLNSIERRLSRLMLTIGDDDTRRGDIQVRITTSSNTSIQVHNLSMALMSSIEGTIS